MAKRLIIAGGLLLLVILTIVGIKAFQFISMGKKYASIVQHTYVSDEAARLESWQPNLTSVGNLDPVQGVDVSNQLAGNVTAINFDSGQEVEKGQLLVQIDDSSEQAQLVGYKAQLKLAELSASRAHDIFSKHLNSQADVDTADSNLAQAQSNVQNTEAAIAKKSIHAPFSGRTGIRNVNLGQYLPDGTVIVTVQALDHMYAGFTLPEQDLTILAPKQRVEVTVDAYPGRKFTGEINAIDSKVDPASHNVRVQAIVANPEHLLRAGMFANVYVYAGKTQEVITVSKTAITYSLYGDSVFVIQPDPKDKDAKGNPLLKANEVFIKLGDERGPRVAVTQGLKAGDLVVTSGQQKLHTGTPVDIDNSVSAEGTTGAAANELH